IPLAEVLREPFECGYARLRPGQLFSGAIARQLSWRRRIRRHREIGNAGQKLHDRCCGNGHAMLDRAVRSSNDIGDDTINASACRIKEWAATVPDIRNRTVVLNVIA